MNDVQVPEFLKGGGEMGALMRAHDWATSSVGLPSRWPQSLRAMVRILLNTGHPMYIWWGAEGACLYNDAYRASLGPERHPGALGKPARQVWEELWPLIGPQIDQVMSGRGATWNVNALVPITRHGKREDVSWTYSASPIDDPDAPNGIGGVLVVCSETNEALRASEARHRELARKLSEANRRKDDFLATLAHELRNPLAPIRMGLSMQKLAPDDKQIAASTRAVMERQLTQLVRLIDDLVDVSRLSRGTVELRKSPLSLSATLNDAVELSRPSIEQSGHELIITLPDEPVIIEADAARVVQVISNLLNNAARFTASGGKLELGLRREGTNAVIFVRDNGPGIEPEMLERVFDLFTQVESSHARVGGGLGIGLALVKHMVELHGGTVEARSGGAGKGSEFVVTLPLAGATYPAAPSAVPSIPSAAQRKKVLVADDNEDASESLSMALTLSGHETRVAHDGAQALAMAREFRPDVMLLDIAMPLLDGHAVARQVRQEPWGRSVLLIAISGWGQPEDARRSREAGFDHHLVKPLELEKIDELLAQQR